MAEKLAKPLSIGGVNEQGSDVEIIVNRSETGVLLTLEVKTGDLICKSIDFANLDPTMWQFLKQTILGWLRW